MVITMKCSNFYPKFVVMEKTEIKRNKLSDNSWLKDILELLSKKIYPEIKFFPTIYT